MVRVELIYYRAFLAVMPLLMTLLLVSCNDENVEEEEETDYPVVETLVVREAPFQEWIMTTGTVEAESDALLRAELAGTVIQMAREGDRVETGDVIMRTDQDQAEAGLRQARAAVEEAETMLAQTEDELQRVEPLGTDTIVSPLELNQLRAQHRQSQASLQQAQAQLREAQQMFDQTELRSPFDGVIEERWVRDGEQVSAGQDIVRIIGTAGLEVTAGVPGRFAGDIQPGAQAIIQLHAYGIGERSAIVDVVGAAIDPQSGTFPIRIGIDDPNGTVKADMIARIRVVRQTIDEALVVPPTAVQRDQEGESVLVAEFSDTLAWVERREVVTGPRSEEGIVIMRGVQAGEDIVITGISGTVDGDTVRIGQRYEDIDVYRSAVEEEIMDSQSETAREQ